MLTHSLGAGIGRAFDAVDGLPREAHLCGNSSDSEAGSNPFEFQVKAGGVWHGCSIGAVVTSVKPVRTAKPSGNNCHACSYMGLDNCQDRRNVSTVTRTRYHTPPVPPTTAWARHLDAVARAEGLSQSGMFRKLREAVGLGPESRSAFLPYLADKEPGEIHAKALAAIVGWPPEPETNEIVKAPVDPIVAAINHQTEALTALVRELQRDRNEDRVEIAKLKATVNGLLEGTLGPRDTANAVSPVSPQEKAE